jgi:hypothetical protein
LKDRKKTMDFGVDIIEVLPYSFLLSSVNYSIDSVLKILKYVIEKNFFNYTYF